ncbi:MAG: nicotinamide riboside transporter PnuC [Oscillospiraceae bacterium]
MKIRNPFKGLTKFEWILWLSSIVVVISSFVMSKGQGLLNCIASLIGVTALIFVSKGDVFGQILTVVFSLFYGIISFRFRYYGEMITYLGMTAPIAVVSVISWIKHPYNNSTEVEVQHLKKRQICNIVILTVIITFVFYFILKFFNTENLIISTFSVATSFSASFLTFLRSPYYALAYSTNDIVLIVLWILATISDLSYMPMIFCFLMFLINDIYGYYNWVRIKKRQSIR